MERVILFERKYNKLTIIYDGQLSKGSNIIVDCQCECGRMTKAQAHKVISGHTKSCGKCNLISAEEMMTRIFGSLRMVNPADIKPGSDKKVEWVCDCGNKFTTSICAVVNEIVTSCRDCSGGRASRMLSVKSQKPSVKRPIISASEMTNKPFGKLTIKHPVDLSECSAKLIEWTCQCGKETSVKAYKVFSGHTRSCGRCNVISAKDIAFRTFGKLTIKDPIDIKPGSHDKLLWVCSCGNETLVAVLSVLSGNTNSCGRCNTIPASVIATTKFGRLRMAVACDTNPQSSKHETWMCDCGGVHIAKTAHVISGRTSSCGRCSMNLYNNWYLANKDVIQALKCPIDSSQIPEGGLIALETIKLVKHQFRAICPLCKRDDWFPAWQRIRNGISITCGCSYNLISKANREISEYINQLGYETKLEHQINGWKYDIFVPKSNLLIEYNGIRWHATDRAKTRDAKKCVNAVQAGYRIMIIKEEEWTKQKQLTEDELKIWVECDS